MINPAQVESFFLICLNRVSGLRSAYTSAVQKGLNDSTKDEWFYSIFSMINVLWIYGQDTTNACLTNAQVVTIMNYLNQQLEINACLTDLPFTTLNFPRDFNSSDFSPIDFA
jgi:hypothetical protein